MTRFLTETAAGYAPAPWRADISVPRTYLATLGDPTRTGSGVTVADGDTWLDCPPPRPYPPGPVGTYKPAPGVSVGVEPKNYSLTPYPLTGGPFGDIVAGLLTISTPNTTIFGYSIPARVKSITTGTVLDTCKVIGPPLAQQPTTDFALVDATDTACAAMLVVDTTIQPQFPSAACNGWRGHDIHLLRTLVLNCCDGGDPYNAAGRAAAVNTQVEACYIGLLAGFGPDSIGRPFSHNDCIQWTGGWGLTITGTVLSGFLDPTIGQANTSANPNYPKMNSNACLQVTQSTGDARGLSMSKNWIYGGGVGLNLALTGGAAGNIGAIFDNQYGHDQYFQGGAASGDGVYGSGGDNTVAWLNYGYTYSRTDLNRYEDNQHPIVIR